MILATSTEQGDRGPLSVWDAQTGRKILTLPKAGSRAVWGPDETKLLLYSSAPRTDVFDLSLFDLATQHILQTFHHKEMILRAFLNKAGTRVISYGQNVCVFEVESGKLLLTLQSFDYVRHACLNADETLSLTAGDDELPPV